MKFTAEAQRAQSMAGCRGNHSRIAPADTMSGPGDTMRTAFRAREIRTHDADAQTGTIFVRTSILEAPTPIMEGGTESMET